MSDQAKTPFLVHCGQCAHEWAAAYLPLSITAFAQLGRAPCPMCGSKQVLIGALPKETPEGDPIAWISGGDTGISSKAIWSVMMGRPAEDRYGDNTPRDPADFGRCYRLLKIMPSWRPRLLEVAALFPKWTGLVSAWDELTALYEEELPRRQCPKLYARMQELRGEAVR